MPIDDFHVPGDLSDSDIVIWCECGSELPVDPDTGECVVCFFDRLRESRTDSPAVMLGAIPAFVLLFLLLALGG